MKVLICIPIYNEEKNIGSVLDELQTICPDFDVLIVDDCSTDASVASIELRERVSVVGLSTNLGIGGARQAGFKYAHYNHYDVLVQMDGDGQHDPRYIRSMLDTLKKGYSICIGSRFILNKGFQSSFLRRMGIGFLYALIKLISGQQVFDATSGFRVCDKKAIRLFAMNYPQDYPEPESIVTAVKNKLRICEVPVEMKRRQNGKSSIGKSDSVYFLFKVTLAILIDALSERE